MNGASSLVVDVASMTRIGNDKNNVDDTGDDMLDATGGHWAM